MNRAPNSWHSVYCLEHSKCRGKAQMNVYAPMPGTVSSWLLFLTNPTFLQLKKSQCVLLTWWHSASSDQQRFGGGALLHLFIQGPNILMALPLQTNGLLASPWCWHQEKSWKTTCRKILRAKLGNDPHHFCSHPIDQKSVTWPRLTAREA